MIGGLLARGMPPASIGVIELRPEARNALTWSTYAALESAVRNSTARCLVITGADPAFCSGDDVKQIMANAGAEVSSGLRAEPRLTPTAGSLLRTRVPVIAAMQGHALGGVHHGGIADVGDSVG